MNIPDETLEKLRDAYIEYEIERENERYLMSKLCLAVEDVLKVAMMEEDARLEIFKRTLDATRKELGNGAEIRR